MSVFISSIAELSQNFFNSDPLKFNDYFAITPGYQKYCLGANLPTRFTLTLAKEAMLIHDIAIHLLAGGCKLTMGGVKGICAIASGIFGLETDHQTPSKQAVVHFGFACFYFMDFFISITSISNRYPQHVVDKIKSLFTKFLEVPNKGAIIKYIIDPETEEALNRKQLELEEKDLALQEERRKAEELSKRDSILEAELEAEMEKISKEARQITKVTSREKNSTEVKPITVSSIINTLPKPFQYMPITYIKDDDNSGSDSASIDPLTNEEDPWMDDKLDENEIFTEEKAEHLLKKESVIPIESIPINKNSNKKPPNRKKTHQITVAPGDFRTRVSQYSLEVRKRNQGLSTNPQNKRPIKE
ncbi:MAG: hypothetical protein C5B45_06255 [Chlamydiae bacterium]|nr:MAG: hypothetical protein C5B45_06255 [Chlamydiota bacterium]